MLIKWKRETGVTLPSDLYVLSSKIFKKNSMQLSWIMILFATNVYYLYIARMAIGLAGSGAFFVIPVFVSEIADDK